MRATRRRATLARALLAGLVGAQIAYGSGGRPRSPATTRALVLLMTATSAAEAIEARGARRGGLLLGVAAGVGFGAELIGVRTGRPFGHYAYSDRLGPRIGGVPLLAAAAWAMMARPAWVTAGWLRRRRLIRIPLAAAALTAWDVFLDPRMAREGYWEWPGGGRYEGVPASNFAGWFVTGLGVFTGASLIDDSPPGPKDDVALVLYAWTWIGEAVANALLWRRPVTAAAGSAAMGAMALPALRRRLA
jgi:uncharacterized membrane protein